MGLTARVLVSKKLHRFVPLLGTVAALGSCHDDHRSITDLQRPLESAAVVAATSTTFFQPISDTYLGIDSINYATNATLNLYTWPDNMIANATVMKFNLTIIPAGSTISSATLYLRLVGTDATSDPTYTVTVHKIINKNPDPSRATGYTYDGANEWSPSTCCYEEIPLAQSDIGPAVDTRNIDKVVGSWKQWNVTSIIQEWVSNPSTNYGLLLNSDASKLRDRWRYFDSNEAVDHPFLEVVYTPPPPPGGAWPNEPAGFTVVSDYAFDDPIPTGQGVLVGGGWSINNPSGYATRVSDPAAPLSLPNVARWRYPVGFGGGSAPATMYRGLGAPRTELFFGYWWKVSNPWQGHPSNVNKISFVMAQQSPGDNFIVGMYGPPGGPYRLMLTLQFPTSNGHLVNSSGDDPGTRHLFGNVNGGNYIVTPGQWYRIEVYFKMSTTTTSTDGIIRWWVNGTAVGDYTTVNFNAGNPYLEYQFSPTWGGASGVKTEEDYYWFDHVRLSVP